MIVITGAAGFIGWNLYNKLNHCRDILLVDFVDKFTDDFTPAHKTMDPFDFLTSLKNNKFAESIEIIFHLGACSSTTVYDPVYMMAHNTDYSIELLKYCVAHKIRLVYASSASVYGDGPYHEDAYLNPKNTYANSKRVFDDYVSSFIGTTDSQIVGLRYFNVYGPHEHRKNKMASVMCQFKKQIDDSGTVKIFKGSDQFLRDFIYVDDVVDVNRHFLDNPNVSGIFNCGTGIAESFSAIPEALSDYYNFKVQEIDMPIDLVNKYQKFTRADTDKLRLVANYEKPFHSLRGGIYKYVEFWKENER